MKKEQHDKFNSLPCNLPIINDSTLELVSQKDF